MKNDSEKRILNKQLPRIPREINLRRWLMNRLRIRKRHLLDRSLIRELRKFNNNSNNNNHYRSNNNRSKMILQVVRAAVWISAAILIIFLLRMSLLLRHSYCNPLLNHRHWNDCHLQRKIRLSVMSQKRLTVHSHRRIYKIAWFTQLRSLKVQLWKHLHLLRQSAWQNNYSKCVDSSIRWRNILTLVCIWRRWNSSGLKCFVCWNYRWSLLCVGTKTR